MRMNDSQNRNMQGKNVQRPQNQNRARVPQQTNEDKALVEASNRFAKNLEKYPEEEATAICIIMNNVLNGCSWGFVPESNTDFVKMLPKIKNSKVVSAMRVGGNDGRKGYIVSMPMNHIINVLNVEAKGLISQQDLIDASENRKAAIIDLNKFMQSGKTGYIGIFNLNDSSNIVIKGVSYPAFAVTFSDLLTLCVRNNYKIVANGKLISPNNAAANQEEVIRNALLAPSYNAMLIQIAK